LLLIITTCTTDYWHRTDDVLAGWAVGCFGAVYAFYMITLLPHKLAVIDARQQQERLASSSNSNNNINNMNISNNNSSENTAAVPRRQAHEIQQPLQQQRQLPVAVSAGTNGSGGAHELTTAEKNI
jgi:hypothetical protein